MGQEMVDFFPEPRDSDSLPPHDAQPEWAGPPDDVMPVLVPIHLILGRSDNAVVVLTRVRAYRSGLAISITAQTRQADRHDDLGRELMWHPDIGGPDPSWHANRFKWGVEFADGRKATNVDPDRGPADGRFEPNWKPDHPVLMINGGVSAVSGPPTWSAGCGRCRHRGACGWSVSGLVRASTSPCMSWRHSLSLDAGPSQRLWPKPGQRRG